MRGRRMRSKGTAAAARSIPRLLVVEDERVFARALERHLQRNDFDAEVVASLREAEHALAERMPDMVLSDLRLPDGSALEFLAHIRERYGKDLPVVVMSAYGELEDAVEAMKLGAVEYLRKPFDLDELLLHLRKALQKVEQQQEPAAVAPVGQSTMLGDSAVMVAVRQSVQRIAALSGDARRAPPNVLITGETGTGKDLLASLLHANSGRAARPFVQVDCAALPAELIEAELFGHEKGAFTGAQGHRVGLIEASGDGTLFLDEVVEVPLPLQAKLLAVLERRSLRRIGSVRERTVNAWFMAAANRDLGQLIQQGEFRPDLYYRLNVVNVHLPPLRERGDDVAQLAAHFARQTMQQFGLAADRSLSAPVMQRIREYSWPGNVRELKHVVERAMLLNEGDPAQLLPTSSPVATTQYRTDVSSSPPRHTLAEHERAQLLEALQEAGGNISQAARGLSISRMTMRYRMQKHGITRDEA